MPERAGQPLAWYEGVWAGSVPGPATERPLYVLQRGAGVFPILGQIIETSSPGVKRGTSLVVRVHREAHDQVGNQDGPLTRQPQRGASVARVLGRTRGLVVQDPSHLTCPLELSKIKPSGS